MINIAIVEDEHAESDLLKSYIDTYSKKQNVEFSVKSFDNPHVFLSNYNGGYDIVFMDIEMPYMDGLTVAHRLRDADSDVTIIFVTNMAQCAVNGYEVNALDFIIKPVSYLSFELKLRRALEYRRNRGGMKIIVKVVGGFECINTSELKYVEIINHNLIFHATRGNFQSYAQLKRIESPLLEHGFMRISRCFLVNLRYVKSVQGYDVEVGEDKIQVAHQKRTELMRALADYLGGGVV